MRNATPGKRNTFSHANRTRPAEVAEEVYWETVRRLGEVSPGFIPPKRVRGFLSRFRDRGIFAIDSTVIKLALSCIASFPYRSKKVAAKMHARLPVGSFIPSVVRVEAGVGERVEVRGRYATHPRQLRRVYLRDVHDLVEAEQVQELREHQQVHLRAVREPPRLDLLDYQRLKNMAALVVAVAYFAAAWLGKKVKLDALAKHVAKVSRKMFEVPEFFYYAIADGLRWLFVRHGKWRGWKCPREECGDLQMEFELLSG